MRAPNPERARAPRTKPARRAAVIHCAVVGAGPAGLTAALYLARYRRSVTVLHDGESRALRIPLAHNAPGFPNGVRGASLVSRMEKQAKRYGALIRPAHVSELARRDSVFVLKHEGGETVARSVILATGIRLNQVDLPHDVHEAAIACGCLRYCPVCDGFEATDRRVAVVGSDTHGAAEALFLRAFARDVTLVPKHKAGLTETERQALHQAGVEIIDEPPTALVPGESRMVLRFANRPDLEVDVLYPALGCAPRHELALQLGIEVTPEGCVITDDAQQTALGGLWAAGDIVDGLDQISVAIGHGAIAATKAHNHLRVIDRETLPPA